MADTRHSAKRRLTETLLGEDLSVYVSRCRAAGDSWRQISLAIQRQVDVDLHPETLRLWFREEVAA